MKKEEILNLLRHRMAQYPAHSELERELTKQFPAEKLAEIIDRFPPAMRQEIIIEFLEDKPVRRITRNLRKK